MVGEWIVDSSVDPPSSDFRRRFALARRVGATRPLNCGTDYEDDDEKAANHADPFWTVTESDF